MQDQDRRAARAAYKDIVSVAGVFVVRASVSGQCWVGMSMDLAAIQRRLWFELRQGGAKPVALQQAWAQEGAAAVSFEELARLPEDTQAVARRRLLQEMRDHWQAQLGAFIL